VVATAVAVAAVVPVPDPVVADAAEPKTDVGKEVIAEPLSVAVADAVAGTASSPKPAKQALELACPQHESILVCAMLVQNLHTPSTSSWKIWLDALACRVDSAGRSCKKFVHMLTDAVSEPTKVAGMAVEPTNWEKSAESARERDRKKKGKKRERSFIVACSRFGSGYLVVGEYQSDDLKTTYAERASMVISPFILHIPDTKCPDFGAPKKRQPAIDPNHPEHPLAIPYPQACLGKLFPALTYIHMPIRDNFNSCQDHTHIRPDSDPQQRIAARLASRF
jgi:hypothetical protein